MIDSHCHLDFDAYDDCRDEIIDEASQAGVKTLINIGVDIPSSQRSIQLARKYENVYATVGIHPHDASKFNKSTLDQLKDFSSDDKVVAIGEIGLDYYRDLSPRADQERAFRAQLELATEVNLPVVIHTRDSFDDTVRIVSEYASKLAGGVFHCFPESSDGARRVIDLGFVISVGGVITYKNSSMAKTAAEIDLEYIMLETDSPYLTPVPFRGKRNSPAYLPHIRDKLAELQKKTPTEVEQVTERVTRKLFRLDDMFEG